MSENKEKKTFEPVPEGEYIVTLDDAKEEKFKNGSGRKMTLKFKIAKGDHRNRVIFHDLPIEHTSQAYTASGRKGGDLLLKALGVEGGMDAVGEDMGVLMDYIGDQVVASVYIEKGNTYEKDGKTLQGKDKNKIRLFKTR